MQKEGLEQQNNGPKVMKYTGKGMGIVVDLSCSYMRKLGDRIRYIWKDAVIDGAFWERVINAYLSGKNQMIMEGIETSADMNRYIAVYGPEEKHVKIRSIDRKSTRLNSSH